MQKTSGAGPNPHISNPTPQSRNPQPQTPTPYPNKGIYTLSSKFVRFRVTPHRAILYSFLVQTLPLQKFQIALSEICTTKRLNGRIFFIFFFFFTLVAGPRKSLSLMLSDQRVISLRYVPAPSSRHWKMCMNVIHAFDGQDSI